MASKGPKKKESKDQVATGGKEYDFFTCIFLSLKLSISYLFFKCNSASAELKKPNRLFRD